MSLYKKQPISISRKIALIFAAVFVIEIFLFTISLSLTTTNLRKDSTYSLIDNFLISAESLVKRSDISILDNIDAANVELIVIMSSDNYSYSDNLLSFLNEKQITEVVKRIVVLKSNNKELKGDIDIPSGKMYYSATTTDDGIIVVGLSDGSYLNTSMFNTVTYILAIYMVVFIIGAFIIIIWAQSVVNRLNKLCDFVVNMSANNYKNSYIDDGDDEIEKLSHKIDDMRRTIIKDEETKESMLQNISHDLKTPIAVIRSYAEAIGDGVESIEATNIIIEQATKLEKKVKRLIEFNKLEYLSSEGKLEAVKMAPIIETIINNCKHISNKINFQSTLDDTIFFGKYENYYTVCENIIENSIRYAKKTIEIKLVDGVLSIHNDGKPIDEQFIQNGFKPYEKGSEGKFGLGMSIVWRTLDYFNMELTAVNENNGVTFIIKAK